MPQPDTEINAETVIAVLREDLEATRWQNVVLRAQLREMAAAAAAAPTTPEHPVD